MLHREFMNPPELPDWSDAFSQIVVVSAGALRIVTISGQVAVDADYRIIGRGDLAAQAEWAFANLAVALRAADARPEDVVRLGIYIKDYRREQAAIVRHAMRQLFTGDRLPASTWLGVQALALDDLLIEVEATAIVDAAKLDAAA
jgi:enamine deaminase RidA (YjgF/YER057c/UK114 family)